MIDVIERACVIIAVASSITALFVVIMFLVMVLKEVDK